jgi:hypothetical protein
MSASKTETAILAVVAALQAAAEAEGSKLPAPARNADLVTRLAEVDAGARLAAYLNVLDGDRVAADETLGADLGQNEPFDLTWRVRVEWAVAGGEDADREAHFDAGRAAIWDALKPDASGASVTYLGGAVDSIRCVDILPQAGTVLDGVPHIKACEFVFDLTYTSDRPF